MQSEKRLFLAAVLVLIMNFILLAKIGDLSNQVENLNRSNNNLQSSLNEITSNVNQSLSQFTREQSWISPVEVNNEKNTVGNEAGTAVLNWQIKDYPENAEVIFHYRQAEAEEFKNIPAVNKGAGFFEVSLPMEIKVEPFWDIQVVKSKNFGSAASEVAKLPEQTVAYSCYVSMKTGNLIKSSEISYFDVGYLAKVKYEPIQGHVAIKNNKYDISLVERQEYDAVLVKFFAGDQLIATKAMHVPADQKGLRSYALSYDSGSQSISHIVIQVKYRNGNTFEKEI